MICIIAENVFGQFITGHVRRGHVFLFYFGTLPDWFVCSVFTLQPAKHKLILNTAHVAWLGMIFALILQKQSHKEQGLVAPFVDFHSRLYIIFTAVQKKKWKRAFFELHITRCKSKNESIHTLLSVFWFAFKEGSKMPKAIKSSP